MTYINYYENFEKFFIPFEDDLGIKCHNTFYNKDVICPITINNSITIGIQYDSNNNVIVIYVNVIEHSKIEWFRLCEIDEHNIVIDYFNGISFTLYERILKEAIDILDEQFELHKEYFSLEYYLNCNIVNNMLTTYNKNIT